MSLKTAKLIKHIDLTHDVFDLVFQTQTPLEFSAGQFITIKIDDKVPPCFRAYSIASSPSAGSQEFKLCVKRVEEGRGSNWLNQLDINQNIQFIGPNGKFTFNKTDKKVLFVATGTGIAPFTSMIEDQINQGKNQEMAMIFGVRHMKDLFYQEWLEKLHQKNPKFNYHITLSRPESDQWQGHTGRVTAVLENYNLDPENTEIYICGLKDMIDSVLEILKNKGVPENSIHFEKYD